MAKPVTQKVLSKVLPIEDALIDKAIKSISRCEAKIHKITLSCKKLDLNKVQKDIGPIFIDPKYVPDGRRANYRKKGIKQLKEGKLLFFFNPVSHLLPWCMVEFSYPSKELLSRIDQWVTDPGVQVSEAELAIDVFCKNKEDVKKLYEIMQSCLYFPYQKKAIELLSHSQNVGPDDLINNVMRHSKFKLYTRGRDNDKTDDHWKDEDVDRVRLEYTAKGEDGDFINNRRANIALSDFNQAGPQFAKIMEGRFRFVRFVGEKFRERIPYGGNSFHERFLYFKHTKRVKNPNQYMRNVEAWDVLIKMMHEAMARFDQNWMRKCKYRESL